MSTANFSHQIRELMDAPPIEDSLVVSSQFAPWEEFIIHHLDSSEIMESSKYEYKELNEKCRTHINKHNKGIHADTVIIGIHPFFTHLSQWSHIDNGKINQMNAYDDRLTSLLRAKRDPKKISIVMFETPRHYPVSTAYLLEQGIIDDVFLTKFNQGEIERLYDARPIAGRRCIAFGGYNDCCLKTGIDSIEKLASRRKLWVIPELCLQPPYMKELQPKLIKREIGSVPRSRHLTIGEVASKYELTIQ